MVSWYQFPYKPVASGWKGRFVLFQLLRYLKPFRKEVFWGPLFKWIEAVFDLVLPLLMARIIDVGVAARDSSYVIRMSLCMFGISLLGLFCALICQYLAARASQGFGTVVRNKLFAHVQSLSHAEIDGLGTPSLITRITNDVNQLQVAVAMAIRLAIRAPFLIIGATVMAMLLDLKLSCVFLVAAPLVAFTLYLVMSRSIPFYRMIQQKLDGLGRITRENLSGVRVIRAFSRQQTEKARFQQASASLCADSLLVGRISALLNPLTACIINLAILAILWFGGVRVQIGALSQGQVIAFINYLNQILLAMIAAANLVVIFTRAAASGQRVQAVFDTQPSVISPSVSQTAASTASAPRVAFDHVSFAYAGAEKPVLSDICFAAAPGQTIGIIGGTGAGKSTLCQLIPRFYDATDGTVYIDGLPVDQIPLPHLRARIGYVPQHAVLFAGTLRQNMQWADPHASDERIWQALETAQAAALVQAMPQGLDSPITQGGQNLSGGQRQRLTIARALVGQPDILILDDSASALDFATDAALRAALHRQMRKQTMFVISQRVHAIAQADQILVLDDGRLVGCGTHDTLLAACPVYAQIVQSQQQKEEHA